MREWLPLVAGLRAGLAQFDEAFMKKYEVPLNVNDCEAKR
jgi:hypothetical protein